MSALTSLLARDQVVAVRKIEEALQKQVVAGGDIASVLLELDALPENTLAAYGAALYGRLPATRDEVMRAPRDVVRVVPREVAEKHRLVPIALDAMASGAAGPTLLVAIAVPLSQEIETQISFLLGHTLVSRVVCEVRIAAALSHHYGVEPSPRMRRLIERLREREAGPVPYVAPPESGKIQSSALAGLTKKSSAATSFLDDGDEADEPVIPKEIPSQLRPSGLPPSEGRTTDPLGIARPLSAPPDKTIVDDAPVKTNPPPRRVSVPPPASVPPIRTPITAAPSELLPSVAPRTEARPAVSRPPEPRPPERPRSEHPVGALPPRRALVAPDPQAGADLKQAAESSSRALRRLRGPLTASQAVQLLETAQGRDDVLEVLFAFARQFFDYAVTFTLHDDIAEARSSYGAGIGGEELKRVKVVLGPIEAPRGILAEARARLAPLVAPLDRNEIDRALARDLEQAPRAVAVVVPVAIRKRPVLMILGIRTNESFTVADVPELVGFVPRVVDALERIILRKKKSFSSSTASDRSDLKAAARDARNSAPPRPRSRSYDRWGPDPVTAPAPDAERLTAPGIGPASAPPAPSTASQSRRDGSLADAILAGAQQESRISAPPPVDVRLAIPEPVPSRNLLGIPRSAPPPPDGSDFLLPVVSLPPREAAPPPSFAPELFAPETREGGRLTDPAPPPVEESDEPELSFSEGDDGDDDDEPELSVSEGGDDDWDGEEEDGEDESEFEGRKTQPSMPAVNPVSSVPPAVLISPTPVASGYSMQDLDEEVVIPLKRRSRSSAPPPKSPSIDPPKPKSEAPVDPRREDNDVPSGDRIAMAAIERVGPVERNVERTGAPRTPEPLAHPRGDVPSVIVDMGDAVDNLVVDLQHAGPDDERAAVNALLRLGEAALPVLAQTFPGPLWFDRHRPHRRAPRGRDTCAIARAFYAFGVRATPYVATLMSSSQPDKRYYALLLAGDMVHPSLIDAVIARVFDEDDSIRKLSHEIAPRFRGLSGWDEQLAIVRRAARIRGKDPRRRVHALSALAAMRDVGALRMLVELLEDDDRDVVRYAHLALVTLTAEDLGPSPRKWASWVDKNDGRHRIEWLIDALTHADEALRTNAGDELKQLTQQYFGFHPATTRREREVAQTKYRQWWATDGKKQFG